MTHITIVTAHIDDTRTVNLLAAILEAAGAKDLRELRNGVSANFDDADVARDTYDGIIARAKDDWDLRQRLGGSTIREVTPTVLKYVESDTHGIS